ncbi:Mitochondrial brown fat uncoupling protein 1 [Symbiodinium microadriaticum]|uniref:Mitochondrial brown fat uncoupling protein 1 n=2 Tax=Symbiodinium TaxID=2949 RepID=A0A1Q9DII6_SYMMI|nr:Mitochondrial brown fat uncoupling protein 1 [Symbiodinium microadriaticum]CAE7316082.1 UCP1 [Symbiodinium sp. KB8]
MAPDDIGRNTLAAAMAGWVQPAIFNPVDCLRIRWQVSVDETTFAKFTAELLRKEGLWQGLWRPGLPFNMCAVAVSQGLRMGLYPTARDALQTLLPSDGQKSSAAMIGAGLMSGSFAYFTGAPLWLVKTRMQAAVQFAADGASTAVQIYPVHLSDYWRGCSPLILRGALLTAGQMFGYDGTKTAGRRLGYKDGPVLHVAAATSAGFCAASFSAPADALMTEYQSSSDGGLLRSAGNMLRKRGPAAFVRGWTANFCRLAPTFTVGSVIYEQMRLLLGLGYMT